MFSAIYRHLFSSAPAPIPVASIETLPKELGNKVFKKDGGTIQLVDRPTGWKLWFLSGNHRQQYREGAEHGATDLLTSKFDTHAATRFKTYYQGHDWVNQPLDVQTFLTFVQGETSLRKDTINAKELTQHQDGKEPVTLETIQTQLSSAQDDNVIIGAVTSDTSLASTTPQAPKTVLEIIGSWFSSPWSNHRQVNEQQKSDADDADRKDSRQEGIAAARAAIAQAFPEGTLGKDTVLALFDTSFTITAEARTPKTELKVSELKSFLNQAIVARNEANTLLSHLQQDATERVTALKTYLKERYDYIAHGQMTKDMIKATFHYVIETLRPEIKKEIETDLQAAVTQAKAAPGEAARSVVTSSEEFFDDLMRAVQEHLNNLGT